jgi:indolepyruvate ferredoxin oxidoreductase
MEILTRYQDAAYAKRYELLVTAVREAESRLGLGNKLSLAVARYYFKLMAYKDEYEVARLYSDPSYMEALKNQFEGDFRLTFHLAPPLLTKPGPDGRIRKMTFGPWMMTAFKLLAKFKHLRGTALDVFGYSHERQLERQLIDDYRAAIESLLPTLSKDNHGLAVEIASLPEEIRGFGHVKDSAVKKTRAKWASLVGQYFARPARVSAA